MRRVAAGRRHTTGIEGESSVTQSVPRTDQQDPCYRGRLAPTAVPVRKDDDVTDAAHVKGNRLDPWLDKSMPPALMVCAPEPWSFAVAARPGRSPSRCRPNLKDLPLDRLRPSRSLRMIRKGRALQYGNVGRTSCLREQIPEIMELEGIDATPRMSSSPPVLSRLLTLSPSSSSIQDASLKR